MLLRRGNGQRKGLYWLIAPCVPLHAGGFFLNQPTRHAQQQNGFDLTACELDKEYFDAAVKRISAHTAQIRIF